MKAFSILCFVLAIFSRSALAENCTFLDEKKEKVDVEVLSLDPHVLRVRYKGDEPDRFYAITKYEKFHHTYTEFAQKKDLKSSLVLKTRKASQIRIEHRKGGNLLTLLLDGKETPLTCERSPAEEEKKN
jgi:hypothetical protein